MTICDEINVIDFGTYVTSGTPQEVRESPAAIAAYLGDDTEEQGADADEAAANESKGVKN
jgi:branched-chain amino acid transport system ATP-binding protein